MDSKGGILKDLSITGYDFGKLIVIDDSNVVHSMYKQNTIQVKEWRKTNKDDRELLDIIEILEQLRFTADVSSSLQEVTQLVQSYK